MPRAQAERRWRALRWAAAGVGAVGLATALLGAGAAAWYAQDLPPLDPVLDYRPRQPLQVFTSDGVEIAQFGSERRQFVPIGQVPRLLHDALLAVEDTGFYEHAGLSPRGLARAVVANLSGGRPQGGSTITQQVARAFFLSTRRTPERKIKEALLALQIERRLSKPQILELYVNQIYLGQRSYGFAAAAATYFGKPLADLTLAETALLAGLPQNPIHANPVVNLARAQRRQAVVLGRMVATGVITEDQRQQALQEPLRLRQPGPREVQAQHVAEMVRQVVAQRFGDRAYAEGLRVITSLRSSEQRAAHGALQQALVAHEDRQPWRGPEDQVDLPADPEAAEDAAALALKDHRDDDLLRVGVLMQVAPGRLRIQLADGRTVAVQGEGLRRVQAALQAPPEAPGAVRRGAVLRVMETAPGRWRVAQWPEAEGAVVSLDPRDGRVRALVGGFDFATRPFNHATQARRQPGSAFKPFLASAAIEHGVMPDSLILDAPLASEGTGAEAPPGWSPRNSDGRFDGPLTLREAMARSKNTVSVRLLQAVGLEPARRWMAHFGIELDRHPRDLTLALGTGSLSPMALAGSYAVLANGGWVVPPLLIERITDAQGQTVFEAPAAPPRTEADRAVPERNVFLVNTLLAEVMRSGTGARGAQALGRGDLHGKTGTTDDAVDAWFAGFHATRVGVVWIGHPQPRSLGEGESGGGLALPVWVETLRDALKGVPESPPAPPDGVTPTGSGHWRYSEWLQRAPHERIGLPEAPSDPATAPVAAPPPAVPPAAVPQRQGMSGAIVSAQS